MTSDMLSTTSRRVALAVCFLAACCILSALVSRRANARIMRSTVIQRLAIAVLILSWIHISISSIFLFALGAGLSEETCEAASISGITSYLATKVAVYAFLLERVYIVWHLRLTPRRKSLTYRLAVLPFSALIGVFVYAIITRHHVLRPGASAASRSTMSCHLGLQPTAAAVLLATSGTLNAVLVILFVIPLLKAQFSRARTIAKKSVLASTAALCSEAAVLGVLLGEGGWERSFAWLGSCSGDVLLNAIIIYIVSSHTSSKSSFDLEADHPPPTPYPDFHSPSNSSKGPLGAQPRPSFARAHSLDHLTLYQDKQERLTGLGYPSRIASPPKVAFVFDRTLRPCPKEERSIEFEGEGEGEGDSPTSMQYMTQVGSTYTASTSQHTLPPRLTIDV